MVAIISTVHFVTDKSHFSSVKSLIYTSYLYLLFLYYNSAPHKIDCHSHPLTKMSFFLNFRELRHLSSYSFSREQVASLIKIFPSPLKFIAHNFFLFPPFSSFSVPLCSSPLHLRQPSPNRQCHPTSSLLRRSHLHSASLSPLYLITLSPLTLNSIA